LKQIIHNLLGSKKDVVFHLQFFSAKAFDKFIRPTDVLEFWNQGRGYLIINPHWTEHVDVHRREMCIFSGTNPPLL
jgi:hypothetical protein